jgi:anaerobic ribonucleoside-triphosphate reductase
MSIKDMKDIVIGKNVYFERTRRITGYCARLERINNAKQAEISERKIHSLGCSEEIAIAA